MYARVVRFTDVNPERIAAIVARVQESGGPPPGVPAKRFNLFFDESQATAVFVAFFETEEDLRQGAETLSNRDPSEVPGTRVSVDECVVRVDERAD